MDERPEERIARYIKENNFDLRKCHRYVKVDEKDYAKNKFLRENDCVCGRSLEWHIKEGCPVRKSAEKPKPWRLEKDTRPYSCDSFGKIKFYPGESIDPTTVVPGASAKYIRLSGRTGDEDYLKLVYNLMTDRRLFAMPNPQLIIEVTGSATEFVHIDKKVIDRFNTSLISAATNANAWLVTGGTHTGIMKLVGDAVTKYRLTNRGKTITCVGFVSWGIVNNRERLTGLREHDLENISETSSQDKISVQSRETTESGTSSTSYGDVPGRWPAEYYVEDQDEDNEYPSLDPGHNCFLLVDNGQDKRFGEEIKFRSRLMHNVASKPLFEKGDIKSLTPIVLLVVGGGMNTLATVEESVCEPATEKDDTKKEKSSYRRPVIILPGFGGCGDVLAFAYTISAPVEDRDLRLYHNHSDLKSIEHSEPYSDFPSDFNERMRKHPEFGRLFYQMSVVKKNQGATQEEMEKAAEELKKREDAFIERIRNVLKNRNFITLVDMFAKEDEHISLDRSIMDAWIKANIGLPQANFTIAELWNRADVAARILLQHHKKICTRDLINDGLIRAIEFDQPLFLDLYLKYGRTDLNKLLRYDQVKKLYQRIVIDQRVRSAKIYAKLFRTLLVNATNDEAVLERGNVKIDSYIGKVLADLLGCYMDNTFTGEAEVTRRQTNQIRKNLSREDSYDAGLRDVFILSLILNRPEMAVRLWTIGADHMGAALMASNFLKSLANEARRLDMMDIGNYYEEHSKEWQDRAITMLSLCYDQDQQRCFQLITRSLHMWQGLTVLEMAYFGRNTLFMDQPAIQSKLNMIWLGKIATFTKPWLIYMTMIPFLLPILLFMLEFEESTLNEQQQQVSNQAAANIDRRFSVVIVEKEPDDDCAGCCPKRTVEPIDNRRPSSVGQDSSSRPQDDLVLLRAGLQSDRKRKTINFIKAGYYLYSSPIAKFTSHAISLGIFLFIFSFFVFVGAKPYNVTPIEIVIWIWACVFMLDKIRMVSTEYSLSPWEKVESFFRDVWIVTEAIAFAFLVAAVILRFVLRPVDFVYPRSAYAVCCLIYWFQTIRFFYMIESMGPRIVVALSMIKDFIYVMIMYSLVVIAFSVPIYALLYPEAPINNAWNFLHLLLHVSYGKMWLVFITSLDETRKVSEGTCRLAPSTETSNNDWASFYVNQNKTGLTTTTETSFVTDDSNNISYDQICSRRNIVALILYIIFLVATNIILMKMLVAFFVGTVEESREFALRIWRFGAYRFIHEYYHKPVLPSPLMIFELIYRLFAHFHTSCKQITVPPKTDFKEYFVGDIGEFEYRKLEMFERSAVEMSLEESARRARKSRDIVISKVRHVSKSLHSRITDVEERLADIYEEVMKMSGKHNIDKTPAASSENVVSHEGVRVQFDLPKSQLYV